MHITGGKLKGRSIPDKKLLLRPTTGKAKQSLFNILQNRVDWGTCNALDLFSGTGSMAFELLSRGCNLVTSVEIEPANCRFIHEAAKKLNIPNFNVVRSDALTFLKKCKVPYDIIIADPPYNYTHYSAIHALIFERQLLKKNGWLVLEHSKRTSFTNSPHMQEQRTYGEVNFSFFTCCAMPV